MYNCNDKIQSERHEVHYDLPTNTNSRQLASNKAEVTSTSLIGPFKDELEVCMYMSQRPDLINLTLSMVKTSGHESEIIQIKPDKSSILSDNVS
jgi:hypothetical protein